MLDNKAIWLGGKLPIEIAKEVLFNATQFYRNIEYIDVFKSEMSSPQNSMSGKIFLGGATSAAQRKGLRPFSAEDLERIQHFSTIEEIHKFIEAHNNSN